MSVSPRAHCLVSTLKSVGNYDTNNKLVGKGGEKRNKGSPDSIASPSVIAVVSMKDRAELSLEERLQQAQEIIKAQQCEINRQNQLIYELQQCVSAGDYETIVGNLDNSNAGTAAAMPVGPAGIRTMMKLSRTQSNGSMVSSPPPSLAADAIVDAGGAVTCGPVSAPGVLGAASPMMPQSMMSQNSLHSQSQKIYRTESDSTGGHSAGGPPNLKGLGARLLNSANSRRRQLNKESLSPPVATSPVSSNQMRDAASVKFRWTKDFGGEHSPLLFIIHDNSLLGTNIARHLCPPETPTLNNPMELLLESKDDRDASLTTLMAADVLFSGLLSEVEGNGESVGMECGTIDTGAAAANNRGSCCIVCRPNSIAYKVDLKSAQQQSSDKKPRIGLRYSTNSTSKDILEFDVHSAPGNLVEVSTRTALHRYLDGCKNSKVDVILHPYCTVDNETVGGGASSCASSSSLWLPYWENATVAKNDEGIVTGILGGRKMAPQFRSQGIGYLRLGDDMSMFGGAYLSLDAGNTFVLNNNNNCNITRMDSSSPALTPQAASAVRTSSASFARGMSDSEISELFTAAAETLCEYVLSGSATVAPPAYLGLQCAPGEVLKWQEVFDHMFSLLAERVAASVSNVEEVSYSYAAPALAVPLLEVRGPRAVASEKSLSSLLDALANVLSKMKQKNPQVVMGAVRAVGYLLPAVSARTGTSAVQMATKQCLVGLLLLLKTHGNKLVQECVSTTLGTQLSRYTAPAEPADRTSVHFSLSYLVRNGVLAEVFPSTVTLQSVKVVQWLQVLVTQEMDLCMWLMLCRPKSAGSSSRPGSAGSPRGGVGPTQSSTLDDVLGGLSLCKLCVAHKDATVREAGLSLAGRMVAYAVVLHSFCHRSARSGLVGLAHESVSEGSITGVLAGISGGMEAAVITMGRASKSCTEKLVKYTNASLARYTLAAGASTSRLPAPAPNPGVAHRGSTPPVSPDKHLRSDLAGHAIQSSALVAGIPNALSDQWYEAKLSLRAPLPHSAQEWEDCYCTLTESISFFQDLTDLATCLAGLQQLTGGGVAVTRQYLFREFILAFDENTSSNDQSDSSGVSSHSVGLFEQLFVAPVTPEATSLLRQVSTLQRGQETPRALLVRYRGLAVSVRRLIRVKMADEADIKQAISTVKLILRFLDGVKQHLAARRSTGSGTVGDVNKETILTVIKQIDTM